MVFFYKIQEFTSNSSTSLPETQGRELMQTIEETEHFFGSVKKTKHKDDERQDFIILPELNKEI